MNLSAADLARSAHVPPRCRTVGRATRDQRGGVPGLNAQLTGAAERRGTPCGIPVRFRGAHRRAQYPERTDPCRACRHQRQRADRAVYADRFTQAGPSDRHAFDAVLRRACHPAVDTTTTPTTSSTPTTYPTSSTPSSTTTSESTTTTYPTSTTETPTSSTVPSTTESPTSSTASTTEAPTTTTTTTSTTVAPTTEAPTTYPPTTYPSTSTAPSTTGADSRRPTTAAPTSVDPRVDHGTDQIDHHRRRQRDDRSEHSITPTRARSRVDRLAVAAGVRQRSVLIVIGACCCSAA